MSNVTLKQTPPLLEKLFADPLLPEKIRRASPEKLAKWIEEIGLEDSGEIMAFATVEQIELIFDLDLWKPLSSGGDELFDSDRFGVWLEILCEIGFKKAADKIVELEEDFLTMSFSSLTWVAETDWLGEGCEEDPRLEKLMESKLHFEIDRFTLFSRNEQNWDTFISVLIEMDSHYPNHLHRVLERCASLLENESESDGLYTILNTDEQLADDVAYEREKRREAQGYVSPANARAYLKLCELEPIQTDHITPKHLLKKNRASAIQNEETDRFAIIAHQPGAYQKIREIFKNNPECGELFTEQLNYLANVLMSGWDWANDQRRPGRALEIALEVCEESLKINTEPFQSFPRTFQLGFKYWYRSHRKQSSEFGGK
jgi:hypothetical protein